MSNTGKFYINGEWVEPIGSDTVDVINPATEDAIGTIALGTHEDVDQLLQLRRMHLKLSPKQQLKNDLNY